jgi:predicted signal transduction protein with EAL and GGDEF domain
VARLSGDEFAIVKSEIDDTKDASDLAAKIVAKLSEPYVIDGHIIDSGASIGIVLAPQDGEDADVLLKNADMALYRAKGGGRQTYRFFEPEMDAELQARRTLDVDLRKALVRGEFVLHYQPVIDLATNRVCGFEALVRWDHPTRGLVLPTEFISAAEETGLIIPLGEWVLRQACAEAAAWPDEIKVAVNLSPVQFKNRNLVGAVISALSSSGLRPSRLELEITESVLLQDSQGTVATLHQLRSLGVRISMDDFGTGYSSLSYLRAFPFDKIKIDQSFVRDLSASGEGAPIIRAVAGLGDGLGMVTNAEGVETAEQLEILREEGYGEAQGYLFSEPRPTEDVPAILARFGAREVKVA